MALAAVGYSQTGYSVELTLIAYPVEASLEARFLDFGPAVERALTARPAWCVGERRRSIQQRLRL